MLKTLVLGDVSVEFIPESISKYEQNIYRRMVGGNAAIMAVQIGKLNGNVSIIGKIGNDEGGEFIKSQFKEYNVNCEGLLNDKKRITALNVLVRNREKEKLYYNNETADNYILPDDINKEIIDRSDIFYINSYLLGREQSKAAVFEAIIYAKDKGKVIVFDAAYSNVFATRNQALEIMSEVIKYADIIKVSEDELNILTNCDKLIRGIAFLINKGIKMVIVTQGTNGCLIASRKGIESVSTYDVKAKDTTYTGASFMGAFIYKFAEKGIMLKEMEFSDFSECADYANAAGAVCSSKQGSIVALPTKEEIEECIEKSEKK